MKVVYLLQHVAREGQDDEDTKTIGVYSSESKAKEIIEKYKLLPGFRLYKDSFYLGELDVDKNHWEDGFVDHKEEGYWKDETLSILKESHSVKDKVKAIVGAINIIYDQVWLQEMCLKNIDHEDELIASAAISGLGDIARIFQKLDFDLVVGKLSELKLKREELAAKIDEAMNDIKAFIK
jgi:hypothetical protein